MKASQINDKSENAKFDHGRAHAYIFIINLSGVMNKANNFYLILFFRSIN